MVFVRVCVPGPQGAEHVDHGDQAEIAQLMIGISQYVPLNAELHAHVLVPSVRHVPPFWQGETEQPIHSLQ